MRMFRSARLLLLAIVVSLVPASSYAGVFISVGFAPPPMPVYVQPPCPEDGLMWTPGYWHYGEMGYYWVPGAWVPAPAPGLLWTPGYWGWSGGNYIFHDGYWGQHVGYYGGVNYGFGYMGMGFAGGGWFGGHFRYNTAVVNVNTTVVRNVYIDRTVVERTTIVNNGHTAYSGGPGGINHQPTAEERVAEHESHQPPSPVQQQHIQQARGNPSSWSKNNGGHPSTPVEAHPLSPSHTAPADGAPHGGKSASDDWSQKTATPPSHTNPQPERVPEPEHNPTASGPGHTPPPAHSQATHSAPPKEPKPTPEPKKK